jgi:hypothetical protein
MCMQVPMGLYRVIDWDWMYVAPLPAAIHHPWFIADTPGWNNDGVRVGETFGEDRAYLPLKDGHVESPC